MSMKAIPQVAILVVGFCTLSGCSSADAPATPAAAGKPEHEVKTTAAWVALAKNDFELAVKHADKVINQFAPAAARMEQQAKDGAAKIPVGAVSAEKEREIFSRGVLNDVAACQFIKAQALHKLGRPEEAKAAFTQASKLTAARVFDPSGSYFWAVAPIAERCIKNPELASKAVHEVIVSDAWAAFNAEDWKKAIAVADECINQFQDAAQAVQDQLTKSGESFPDGAVSDNDRARILKNGILNDVAACLYIKGRAAENIGNRDMARSTYTAAEKFSHARCWDPQGWFWKPGTASADRLPNVK